MSRRPLDRWTGAAARTLHRACMKPSVRASRWFQAMQQIVGPTPQESILSDAMAYVAGSSMPGDYLEFGVWRGASVATAFHAARRHSLSQMRFYGFDSFEGMPGPTGAEADAAGDQHRRGAYSCSIDECTRFLAANRLDLARVKLTPGWFEEVLTDALRDGLAIGPAAVVLVDSGPYRAALAALTFAGPVVQDGTLVAFGDWFSFRASPAQGQQRAFREWLAADPTLSSSPFRRFGWHGNSFVIHRST